MLSVVNEDGTTEIGSLIDEIVREGARRMLAAALEAEVDQYIAELAEQKDERERRLMVRNGRHRPRSVTTAARAVEVAFPRVNDKRVDEATGERMRFSSKILAPWCRKSPKISEVLPLLYLHGLSTSDSVPAMEQFVGTSAKPLCGHRHPAGQAVDGGPRRVPAPRPLGIRLRLRMGGRRPPQDRPVPDPFLSPGPHGRARGWEQGAHRDRRGAA